MSYDLKLKDVTIEKHLAPLPAVLGDRRALQQVLLNLLNNAAQAVTTNPPGRPQVIHLRTWFDDRVRLRVADTGPGIPDDVLPQLFTPFFTTKEPGRGPGWACRSRIRSSRRTAGASPWSDLPTGARRSSSTYQPLPPRPPRRRARRPSRRPRPP